MDLLYTPSAWGSEFHALPHREALGAGAAGPGKSTVLRMDPMSQILSEHKRCEDPRHPYPLKWGQSVGWALFLRRTFPMLTQSIRIAKNIFQRIDANGKWNEKLNMYVFSSGYVYQFGHCLKPDDWQQYFSNEYSHILFDELIQFEEEQYIQIEGRCRSSDPVLRSMLKVRAMSNPHSRLEEAGSKDFTVKDPNWVRRYFVDPEPTGRRTINKTVKLHTGEEVKRSRIYLPATLYDNPDAAFVKDYETTLRTKPVHIQQALLFGNWYHVANGFYSDAWNPDLHICKPFKIPSHWPRFRSMDWGFKKPGTVLYFALDDDDNLYCFHELTFQGKDALEVAKEVREFERKNNMWTPNGSAITGPADNQLWEKRGDVGRSKAEEFSRIGVNWTKADKRSRRRNAERVLSRLMDHENKDTTPGLMFFSTCKQTIKTVPAIGVDPNDPETPADGGPDHWHDALCYACAHASRGRLGITMRKIRAANDPWDDTEETTKDRGRSGYGA